MCFQEPFKNINDDGSRTAMIQALWYVTIQEATRLVLGCWHKEADESLDLARRAGFFPGRLQEREILKRARKEPLLLQGCVGFSFSPAAGLHPYKLGGRGFHDFVPYSQSQVVSCCLLP